MSVLDQDAPLPAGTVAAVVGEGMGGRGGPRPARHGRRARRRRRHAVRRPGQAGGAGPGAGGGRRPGRAAPTSGDLLILDEPTNHLDLDGIAWLEDWLARFPGGLVLVTHDRHVLDRVTTTVLELDRGRSLRARRRLPELARRAGRARRRASAAAETRRRNLARAELAWLRRGAPARTRKPQARIEAATALVERAARGAPARTGDLPLHVDTPRLGDQVVELHGVGDGYGDALAVPRPRPAPRPARAARHRRARTAPASRRCST